MRMLLACNVPEQLYLDESSHSFVLNASNILFHVQVNKTNQRCQTKQYFSETKEIPLNYDLITGFQ